MKRRFQGLSSTAQPDPDVPDGVFLVRIERMQYRRERQKPFYNLELSILDPASLKGRSLSARLYCTPKALWKLSWFLRDFGYDSDLLVRDEIDEKALVGLQGVVKTSHVTVHGRLLLNLDAFAPAEAWEVAS